MEKFSAYRDAGTGIQPFLIPVPPLGSDFLAKIILPLRYVFGFVRIVLVLFLLPAYLALVPGLCLIFAPVPPLHRTMSNIFTSIIARVVLLLLGLFWIPVEQVTKKTRRPGKINESWKPRAGDIIISNWVSWIELLWLAFRFNPIFVLPIFEVTSTTSISSPPSAPVARTSGRRPNAMSADSTYRRGAKNVRMPIIGFRQVSLVSIIRMTGQAPPFGATTSNSPSQTLEDLRSNADRPIVVFPECTTSNGRGLLRFSDVFRQDIPVSNYKIYVMCVRYDPPTIFTPTLTCPIPSTLFNPLAHLFAAATSITPPAISIRLLAPSESPVPQSSTPNEVTTDSAGGDQLAETCATLISQIGKLKRTGMSWEDKVDFLHFYRDKRK